jgi:hypothetical protein
MRHSKLVNRDMHQRKLKLLSKFRSKVRDLSRFLEAFGHQPAFLDEELDDSSTDNEDSSSDWHD